MTEPIAYQFDHIHLYCSNPAETERWLVEGMGAELLGRRDSAGTPMVDLDLGGAKILVRGPRPGESFAPAGARTFGEDHFGLVVKDVDAVVAELKRRGVFVEVEPFNLTPASRISFVKGPDNIRIELVQRQ